MKEGCSSASQTDLIAALYLEFALVDTLLSTCLCVEAIRFAAAAPTATLLLVTAWIRFPAGRSLLAGGASSHYGHDGERANQRQKLLHGDLLH